MLKEPDVYKLKDNIPHKIPIALIVGKYDELATVEDAEWLKEELGSRVVFD